MTTEEAIKILDNCRIKADCARDETLPAEAEKERDDYIEACTMAIEALEKQVSKKVEDIHYVEYYCPACGKQLRPIYFRRQDIMELSEEKKR